MFSDFNFFLPKFTPKRGDQHISFQTSKLLAGSQYDSDSDDVRYGVHRTYFDLSPPDEDPVSLKCSRNYKCSKIYILPLCVNLTFYKVLSKQVNSLKILYDSGIIPI